MIWSDKQIALLKKLWPQGLPAGQIADEIGVGRNAVVGKARRLGLGEHSGSTRNLQLRAAQRVTPQKSGPVSTRLKIRGRHGAFGAGLELQVAPSILPLMPDGSNIPPAQRRTLLQLKPGVCKWPFGEPQSHDFFFCGGDAIEGKPYCAGHCRVAYQAPKR